MALLIDTYRYGPLSFGKVSGSGLVVGGVCTLLQIFFVFLVRHYWDSNFTPINAAETGAALFTYFYPVLIWYYSKNSRKPDRDRVDNL